jgi:hypothetical protein
VTLATDKIATLALLGVILYIGVAAHPAPRPELHCATGWAHRVNSREAFERAYAQGARVLEVDLHWTRDRVLVLAHDWGTHRPPTLAEYRAHSRETPLTYKEVVGLLREYPDARLILDMKWGPRTMAPAVLRETPMALVPRLLPIAWGPADAFILEGLAGWSLAYGTRYGQPTPGQIAAMARRYRIGLMLCPGSNTFSTQ